MISVLALETSTSVSEALTELTLVPVGPLTLIVTLLSPATQSETSALTVISAAEIFLPSILLWLRVTFTVSMLVALTARPLSARSLSPVKLTGTSLYVTRVIGS